MKIGKNGFSLVELIVTIAIISIVAGISTIGLSSVFSMKASSCTDKLISYMDETKTDSLGYDDVELRLYRKPDGYYWVDINQYKYVFSSGVFTPDRSTPVSSVSYMIGDKSLVIKAKMLSGSEYDITHDDLYISFDRASGAFKEAVVIDNVSRAEEDVAVEKYVDEISIQQGTNSPKIIKCLRVTGKFYLE